MQHNVVYLILSAIIIIYDTMINIFVLVIFST